MFRRQYAYVFVLYFLFFVAWELSGQVRLDVCYVASVSSDSVCQSSESIFLKDSLRMSDYLSQRIEELHEQGYLSASLDALSFSDGVYRAVIYTGDCFRWIYLSWNESDFLLQMHGVRKRKIQGTPVSPSHLARLKRKALREVQDQGYPFARVFLSDVSLTDSGVRADLNVDKYRLFVNDSIVNRGEARLNYSFLRQYLGLIPREVYQQKVYDKIDSRLQHLAYVTPLQPSRVQFKDGTADVYLYLNKRRANRLDGMLGILPADEEAGGVKITGDINLQLLNSFSRGEEILFRWNKYEELSQRLKAGLAYPYIRGTNLGLDVDFELFKKDSSYLNTAPELGVRLQGAGMSFVRLFYRQEQSVLLSLEADLSNYRSSRSDLYGMGLHVQQYNKAYNPDKGGGGMFSVSYGERRSGGVVLRQMNLQGQGDIYIRAPGPGTFRLKANGGMRSLFSEHDSLLKAGLADNELFRLGGLQTIRGFDDESILASGYLITGLEYRIAFQEQSVLYLFCDKAFYDRMSVGGFVQDAPMGFGLGLDVGIPAGVVVLNYALGREFNNPFQFRNAKIHVGLISRF